MIFLSLLTLSLIVFLLYIYRVIRLLPATIKYDLGFLVLCLSMALVRGLMLYFNFPFAIFRFDLFNSKFYASSVISPSLGDLLLNILTLCVLSWFIFINYSKFYVYKLITRTSSLMKQLFCVLLVIASCFRVAFSCFYNKYHFL